MEVGKQFNYLYFNFKNSVTLANPFLGLNIVDLPEGSFFGDYQILLGLDAMVDYVANVDSIHGTNTTDEDTWCMTISAKKFISLINQFPEFRSFLLTRGL
jgi:hypothetical protein